MPKNEQLEVSLRAGSEVRGREFKLSMSWTELSTQVKVVKWALGAANLQDGGLLAFGMKPDGALYLPAGMTQADYDSFNQDSVSETVNTHATPHIDLTVNHIDMDEKLFVVIVVRQFTDYPVICAKDVVGEKNKVRLFGVGSTAGAVECRRRRKYKHLRT